MFSASTYVFADSMDGSISLNRSAGILDYEVTRMYVLNVSAQDMGYPSNTAFVLVTILVTVSNSMRYLTIGIIMI